MPRDFQALHLRDSLIEHEDELRLKSGKILLRTMQTPGTSRDFRHDDLSIGIVTSVEEDSRISWHVDGKSMLNKRWRTTSKLNDLIVLPPECNIRDFFSGSGQGLWLHFDREMMEQHEGLSSLLTQPRADTTWSNDSLSRMLISQLCQECSGGFPRGPLFLANAAMMFLTQLACVFGDRLQKLGKPRALNSTMLDLVINYIRDNLHRNITLLELSSLASLSPRHFCAAFKEATGKPPHQFQIECRVERAKALLFDRDLSLANVALMVGFSSQSHLNDHFRRLSGLTPVQFRRHQSRAAH